MDGSATETWVYEVSRRLAAQGMPVRVYCPHEKSGLLRETREGIQFVKFKASALRQRLCVKILGLHQMDSFSTLARYALAENDGWLMLDNIDPSKIPGLSESSEKVGRLIYHAQNEYYWDFEKMGIQRMICCSHFLEKAYRKQGYKGEIDVVPNGVSAEELKIQLSAATREKLKGFDGLFVGRITPEKGVHKLLDALKVLKKQGHTFKVACAAGIPTDKNRPKGCKRLAYFRDLQQRIAEENLDVHFIGAIPHHEVIAAYREIGIGLVPSTFNEPFSMSALEGLAAGAICILSNRGGLPDTAKHLQSPGALLDPDDAEAWAKAMHTAQLTRGINLSDQSEKVLHEFEWSNVAQQMQCFIDRLNSTRKMNHYE